MERIQLDVNKRSAGSKGLARKLRRNGLIPAVIYGDGEPITVSVDAHDWGKRFTHASGNMIVEIKVDGQTYNVLIKDVDDEIVSGRVNHIDFYAIKTGKKLNAMVPIHMDGTPVGVREGGIMEHKIDELEVECLPEDMPEQFSIDISNLDVGDSFHVREVEVPSGVEIRTDPNLTILIIGHSSTTVEDDAPVDEEALIETSEDIEKS